MQNGRFFSHLNTAEKLVSEYQGEFPFHHFLKAFFREHRKYGSRDRKQISSLCYAFFRTGGAWKNITLKDKLLASLFLCDDESSEIIAALKPEWVTAAGKNTTEKIIFLNLSGVEISESEIFPCAEHITSLIDNKPGFVLSHLIQPRLFLRIRPGKEELVEQQLRKAGIAYNIFDHTVELANGTDIASVLVADRDVVVQDLSSQHTAKFIKQALLRAGKGGRVWDCCAASGGKSIMAFDLDPTIDLTVSDIRPAILHNLAGRFERAGINKYHSFVADLTTKQLHDQRYDLVIADVPCSGSGTWGRTPEELCFFDSAKLDRYKLLQQKIIANIKNNLRPGGLLLYFTCSVFTDENEGMVDFIKANTNLEFVSMELISGWETGADTMFAALFTSPA